MSTENMGTILGSLFREKVKKSKDPRMEEGVFDVLYSTGFLEIDFLNGYTVHVNDGSNQFSYDSIGLVDGSTNTLIGRPGSGKTTLAVQMAANIVRNFDQGLIFYDDIEGGSVETRRLVLTGFTQEELTQKMIYRNCAVSAENFYERLSMIADIKLQNRDQFLYDTGKVDSKGEPIFKMQPTVYILDSLAMLSPEKLTEEEKLSGQMSATAMAKTNTQVFKRSIPKIKAANIILIIINHINDKVDISPFAKTRAQVGYLKQDETLPGGKAAIYLTNNLIRVEDMSKLKAEDGMGVSGKIIEISFVKSRTNESGKSVPLVFENKTGFDPDLSLLLFMKSTGGVESRGAYLNVKGSDIKFTQKGFKDKLYTDEQFQYEFNSVCYQKLRELLNDAPIETHNPRKMGATAGIMGMINGNNGMPSQSLPKNYDLGSL